ncbi:hypothetical protein JD844_018544 [Phrynosoma platyrhinos]|uniref:Uncharacterized protein n=1 Tax=Phrynosoma platyrhinos TaxID=52577 RepID=A0ABQ7SNR4_PHRPL|nr:hypothetical protein JD844_018544 [Phrynosoma platyrhinos]
MSIFLSKLQERMELTAGEYELIEHILAAHQKCTIPMEEAKKFVSAGNCQSRTEFSTSFRNSHGSCTGTCGFYKKTPR